MNDKIETIDAETVDEIFNTLKAYYVIKRERDELMKDVRKLQDIKRKHEHEELVAAQENDRLKRERDDYKWQLHIAKGEIAEARKMERAWKKEETK